MRLATGLIAAAFLCCSSSSVFAQPQNVSDALCPDVVPYVVALDKLHPNDVPQLTYDAAHAVQTAYDTCAKRYLAAQNLEPGVHYALTREAFYGVVAGRALVQLGRPADGRRELEHDRAMAQEIVDWTAPNGPGAQQGGSRYSRFREGAQMVVTTANAELAKLPPPSSAVSTASPTASP
jgi:hypothetical protein